MLAAVLVTVVLIRGVVERKGIIRTREGTPLYESQKTEGWFRGLGHDESTMERSQVEICFTDEEVEDGEPEDAQAISPELVSPRSPCCLRSR